MGVKGLQGFMETQCRGAVREVHITHAVDLYRRETGHQPHIVIDASSCISHIYDTLDWIHGGQYLEFLAKLKQFVKAFTDLGVKLTFFFDGPSLERKRGSWIERRASKLDDVISIFDQLKAGISPSDLDSSLSTCPVDITAVAGDILKYVMGCQVFTSIHECDEEVVRYARDFSCFAILGQDTDYVIFRGSHYYWSIKHLNVERMTTVMYNRWTLASSLGIEPAVLPLLASIVGNDIISSENLEAFHKMLRQRYIYTNHHVYPQRYMHKIIVAAAEYLRHIQTEEAMYNVLPEMSRAILGDQNSDLLRSSVESYVISPIPEDIITGTGPVRHWYEIKRKTKQLVQVKLLPAMAYSIVFNQVYESSTSLEDYRVECLPPFALLYQAMRENIYGILLHEHPDQQQLTVKQWCVSGPRSFRTPSLVKPSTISQEIHPGIMNLWSTEKSQEVLNKSWHLFCHGVSVKIPMYDLKRLPVRLIIPAAVLFFLTHEVETFLETWEIDAFVAQAVLLRTYTVADLNQLRMYDTNVRAIQLTTIFLRGVQIVRLLLGVCGCPLNISEMIAFNYFDGKLFHHIYWKAKSGLACMDLCKYKDECILEFQQVKAILGSQ